MFVIFLINTGDNVWDQRRYEAGLEIIMVKVRSQLFKYNDNLRTRVKATAETSYMTRFVTHVCACVMQQDMEMTEMCDSFDFARNK